MEARGWRAWGATAGFGLLSALALPPMHALPVLLIAVLGLLVLIDATQGARQAAMCGFWFGFFHHLIGLYWVTEAILFESARFWWLVPLAVPGLAVILAPFIALACAAARLVPAGWRRALVLAGAWVLADLARQFIGTGFPWNPWGADWAVPGAFGDVFIQPAAWIGVPGLTLLSVLLAATPYLGRRAMIGGAIGLAAWAGFGLWRLDALAASKASGLTVLLVQGNVAQGQKWDQAFRVSIFERYLAMSHQAVGGAKPPVLVVWPETASPFLIETDPNARAAVAEADGVPSLVGSVRFDAAERPRNSLIAVLTTGEASAIYDKWHLVPFGEFQPSWFPLGVQVVPGGGFAAGPGPRTMHLPGIPPAGPLICYEAIFPGQVIDRSDRPDWMVNVTNDAWFGNSTGPRQHLAAARLRAVEEGLPLLRAANTGISAAFDAFGREQGRLGMGVTGVLPVALPGHLPPTFFARAGLWSPGLLAVALVLAAFARPVRRYE